MNFIRQGILSSETIRGGLPMKRRSQKSLTPMQREIRDHRAEMLHISTASMLNRAY